MFNTYRHCRSGYRLQIGLLAAWLHAGARNSKGHIIEYGTKSKSHDNRTECPLASSTAIKFGAFWDGQAPVRLDVKNHFQHPINSNLWWCFFLSEAKTNGQSWSKSAFWVCKSFAHLQSSLMKNFPGVKDCIIGRGRPGQFQYMLDWRPRARHLMTMALN